MIFGGLSNRSVVLAASPFFLKGGGLLFSPWILSFQPSFKLGIHLEIVEIDIFPASVRDQTNNWNVPNDGSHSMQFLAAFHIHHVYIHILHESAWSTCMYLDVTGWKMIDWHGELFDVHHAPVLGQLLSYPVPSCTINVWHRISNFKYLSVHLWVWFLHCAGFWSTVNLIIGEVSIVDVRPNGSILQASCPLPTRQVTWENSRWRVSRGTCRTSRRWNLRSSHVGKNPRSHVLPSWTAMEFHWFVGIIVQ